MRDAHRRGGAATTGVRRPAGGSSPARRRYADAVGLGRGAGAAGSVAGRRGAEARVRGRGGLRAVAQAALLVAAALALTSTPARAALHLRVGLYQNSPKVGLDASGKPEGIFVDLIEGIAEAEGWSIEFVPGTWAEGLDRLAAGEIDLMPDVALTREREELYAFHSEPVLSDWFQIYARDDSGIRSVMDLDGKRVSLLERSVQQEAFQKAVLGFDVNAELVPFPDYAAAFAAVEGGACDAVIANRFYGVAHSRESGLEDTAIIFNPTRLYFAAPKSGDPAVLAAIDQHLAAWKAEPDSPYYQTLRRWTSESVGVGLPVWVYYAGALALALFLLSTVWGAALRHRVAARTEELRASEERFRLIMENLADLVAVLDLAGRRIYNSPSYQGLLGDADGLRGTLSFDEVHPDDRERVEAAFKETVRSGVGQRLEYRLVSRCGRVRHIESQGSVIRDDRGRVANVVVVSRDVTERRETEARIEESERKYRELVEHANSIILRWSREGAVLFLNEFGQRFFGYAEGELLGCHVVGTIVPESEDGGRDLSSFMDDICANPAAYEQNVNQNMRRNGERVWVAWTNKVVLGDDGQVVEILSIGTDITERRLAEDALRELNLTLERRVAERTVELAVARDRAEEADRIKSAFLATMSHELRTPLNSIIGFTGILLQGLAGPLNDEQTKQLGMIQGSGRHLLALINDVLDISKIEAGQIEIHWESVSVPDVVQRAAESVMPLAAKKGLSLVTRVAPEVGTLTSDARRLGQVLLNLLSNAVKFTEAGEVSLECRQDDGSVVFRVRDTGIGIRHEDLETLFKPFRQIDTGLTRQHEGTGLGLAICKRLAERLGGTIGVESEWGEGSTFTVALPIEPGAAP
jgi:PAS domain S-box-containing protein